MSEYSFAVSYGFATNENVDLINNDIDTQILDSTRLSTDNRGGSFALTFDNPLSQESIDKLIQIFRNRDKNVYRGSQILVINTNATVKTPVFKVIGKIPFHNTWKISHIEVTSFMTSGLSSYTIQIYDTNNSQVIAEKQFNNTEVSINDLGTITNLPYSDSIFEINVKTDGPRSLSVNVDSIIITYDTD
jgi:hypothetical protein